MNSVTVDAFDAGDRQLQGYLTRIVVGDQRALPDLYRATFFQVFRLVQRILVDPAHAEEVVQEVYVEIWQSAGRYRPDRGSARGWMLTIARRRAIDRVRATQSSRDRDLRIGIRDHGHDFDSVAEWTEIAFEATKVKQAFLALTAMQRQAVELSYLDQFTHAEISARLSVPLGTVKSRIRDGIARLRIELSNPST